MKKNKETTDYEKMAEELSGLPMKTVLTMYQRAVENDWQTVQSTTQEAIKQMALNPREAEELFDLTRAVLTNENGETLAKALS